MNVISKSTLIKFYESSPKYFDAKEQLNEWYRYTKKSKWTTPHEIKEDIRTASILKNNRVVFNICGNKYRVVVRIDYRYQIIFIRFVGTHSQYDQIEGIDTI